MFERYVLIINGVTYDNSEDLINVKLINRRNEECIIVEVLEECDTNLKVLFKGKRKTHIVEEKYFDNVEVKEIPNYELINYLRERDIKLLLHFTNIKNLRSILTKGLVTKDALEELEEYYVNDHSRFDCTDAICLSISFPNYRMFYPLQKNNPEEKWVVIGVDPEIFFDLDCGFFHRNAAHHTFRDRCDNKYKTVKSLKKMFCDEFPPDLAFGHTHKRIELKIKDCQTTDPQAEVLVFENIPTKYIKAVVYKNVDDMSGFIDVFKDFQHEVIKKAFSYRNDYNFWRGE